jgi:hypothetical protein
VNFWFTSYLGVINTCKILDNYFEGKSLEQYKEYLTSRGLNFYEIKFNNELSYLLEEIPQPAYLRAEGKLDFSISYMLDNIEVTNRIKTTFNIRQNHSNSISIIPVKINAVYAEDPIIVSLAIRFLLEEVLIQPGKRKSWIN